MSKKKKIRSTQIQKNFIQTQTPPQSEIAKFLKHYQSAQYDEAEKLARTFTQKYPDYPFGWKALGAVLKQSGKLYESVKAYKKTMELAPEDVDTQYHLGNALAALNCLEEAAAIYRKVLIVKPSYAEAHCNLGVMLQSLGKLEESEDSFIKAATFKPELVEALSNLGIVQQALGKLEEAETNYKKAIALKPDYAEVHYNLGIPLQALGKIEEAKASFEKAIALKPDYAEAHNNLGVTQQALGRLDAAEASYRSAIVLKGTYAEAYFNLGILLRMLGKIKEAEASFKKVIAIKPDYAAAHLNLGVVLHDGSSVEEAEASYRIAIGLRPDFAEAYCNLGQLLLEKNNLSAALECAIHSIKKKLTTESKSLFIDTLKQIDPKFWDVSLSKMIGTALLEPWGSPSDLMPFSCRLIKRNPLFLQALNCSYDEKSRDDFDDILNNLSSGKFSDFSLLLYTIFSSSYITDDVIEKFATALRRHFLSLEKSIMLAGSEAYVLPKFYCLIAQQCFINEYVYFQTSEEMDESERLRDQLKRVLEDEQEISAVLIIAVACYFPLYSIPGVEKLLKRSWAVEVQAVLKQQIEEPLLELNLRKSISCLTNIDNKVSLAVQSQYEANPYPRWVHLPKETNKKLLNSYIQNKFPSSTFRYLHNDSKPEVLIAGCGTGEHPITTAQLIEGAKVLAVDLSMASLSYAKRKTIELNIDAIDYAQADILKLGSLGRTFDVIESSGVLHHLENPFEGWEVLLSMLRPHGLMRLGFYSELARRDIVRVRDLISQEGVGSSPQEIRNYRQHLTESNRSGKYGSTTNLLDFFSTSMCRDLLFHVQEHRLNLSILAKFIRDHELNFLGFDINRSVMHSYKRRFPDDFSATNLDNWRVYEEENPDTFIGMYQFWVQKKF